MAALLFLIGIVTFTFAYMTLFLATMDIDHSLYNADEPTWPEYLWWTPQKSADKYKEAAKIEFAAAMLFGLTSFVLFMAGLIFVLMMAFQQLA